MRVKRYVVQSMPDALSLIRSELGNDAVILNTKEIRVGGFMGMFRKKRMEVIAAIESEQKPSKQPPRPIAPQQAYRPPAQPPVYSAMQEETAAKATVVAQLRKEEREEPPQALSSPTPAAKQPQSFHKPETDAELAEEIRQMKQMIIGFSRQQTHPISRPAPMQSLYDRLILQEVASERVNQLLEEIATTDGYSTEWTAEATWKAARSILVEWLAPFQTTGITSSVRILHFVGPTGVGKTTTIAKLAAEQALQHKRRAGFITSDTYRIAAVDQLRTYANILNVPLEVVFSPLELSRAFKQLEDRDLIFMDTAGRNFRNELYVSEVNSLIQGRIDSDTYLVLSLTGKSKDMNIVARNFAEYGINKVLFTKSDETDSYGSILNIVLEHQLRPVYIASGQNVPEDIAPFDVQRYVDQLLGEWVNE